MVRETCPGLLYVKERPPTNQTLVHVHTHKNTQGTDRTSVPLKRVWGPETYLVFSTSNKKFNHYCYD